MIGVTRHKRALARALFEKGVFQDKSKSPLGVGFRLRSHDIDPDAPLSPYYLNFRTPKNTKPGPMDGPLLAVLGRTLFHEAKKQKLRFRSVAGLPTAGISLARSFHLFCITEGKYEPAVLINMHKHKDGNFRFISRIPFGAPSPLLIDDVITTAGSIRKVLRAFIPTGISIRECLVVVDREQGGVQELKKQGIYVHAVFTISELIHFYLAEGLLGEECAEEILSYVRESKMIS